MAERFAENIPFGYMTPDPVIDYQREDPDYFDYLGAKAYKTFPAIAFRFYDEPDFDEFIDPNYEPLADPRFSETGRLRTNKRLFAGARSQEELEFQIKKYDKEQEVLRTINDYDYRVGGGRFKGQKAIANFGMELLSDPLTYVPVLGWWAKGAKASHRFMAAGAVGFAAAVPYEYIKRQDSFTRTNAESLITLGTMFMLNGAVGAAFGRARGIKPSPKQSDPNAFTDAKPLALIQRTQDDLADASPSSTVTSPRRVEPEPFNTPEAFEQARRIEPSEEMASIQTGKPTSVTAWRGQTEKPLEGNASRFAGAGANAQYWAMTKSQASTYSDDVIEAEIKLNNPVVINNDDDFIDLVKRATGTDINDDGLMMFFMGNQGRITLEDLARNAGHDAIVIRLWTKANDDTIEASMKLKDEMSNLGAVGGGIGRDGQNLRAMFDQNEIIIFDKQRFKVAPSKDEPRPRSLGAAAANVSLRDLERQESLRATGIGLEDAPLNPLLRLLQGGPEASRIVQDMVEPAGMILNKIDDQIPMVNDSVSTMFKTTYLTPLFTAITKAEEAFLNFRQISGNRQGLTANAYRMLREKARGLAPAHGRNNDLVRTFNERVGLALMRGGDNMADDMTPFVNEAASAYLVVLDLVRDQGTSVNLWIKEIDKKIEKLAEKLETASPTTAGGIRNQMDNLAAVKDKISQHGVQATIRSKGYFPRIYDVDYMLSEAGKAEWLRVVGGAIGREEAQKAWTKITNSFDDTLEGFDSFMDDVATGSAQARLLDIDDELLVPFLSFDVEAVVRDHVRRMGMDIELTRKFGSVDMREAIDSLPTAEAKRDVTALRDILRGNYGRPSDPHSMVNRGISLLRNYSPLVYMGGAAVSSLPDIARPIMTEGINAFMGTSLRLFMGGMRKEILAMNRKTVREVGEALDMVLSMRAFAMADVGSTFGRASTLERSVKNLQVPFFLLNGLNLWTTAMKEFTGLIVTRRMTQAMAKDWQTLPIADKERLLANGIDGPMAARINRLMQMDGMYDQVGSFRFPRLAQWASVDAGAADAFKRALNQQINRTIVTPNAGEKALWTENNIGNVIAQFKSFGQSSTQRMLISGLQERNANFYQGAIAMTALGMVVNELKQVQYGYEKKQNITQMIAEGMDRAGLFAIVSDINHALEVMSSNRVSIDALAGGRPTEQSTRRTISTFAGPSGSIVYDFGQMAQQALSGNLFSQQFMNSTLRVTPYQSHPFFPRGLYAGDGY